MRLLLKRYRLSLEAYLEAEKSVQQPDWEIFHNIAECYVRLGDAKKGKEFVKKAVQCGKQEISFSLLARICDSEGDIKSAIAVCSAALEACPDSTAMMTQQGMFHLRTGETQLAFEKFASALAVKPDCTKALLGIGCITQVHGEYEVALSKYKLALQTKPESIALWNNMGLCFYSKQKYVAAISCFKKALWFSPLNWKVLFNLGLAYLATQQPTSAFTSLCAAVNIRPDFSLSFAVIGCALLDLQDVDNAIKALRQASSISPRKPIILANLSVCLYRKEYYRNALDLVQKLVTLIESEDNVDKEIMELAHNLLKLLKAYKREEAEDTHVENGSNLSQSVVNKIIEKPVDSIDVGHELEPDEV